MAREHGKAKVPSEAVPCCRRFPIWTDEPIPIEQLMREQGIEGPQGSAIVGFADWTEADDAFLHAIMDD